MGADAKRRFQSVGCDPLRRIVSKLQRLPDFLYSRFRKPEAVFTRIYRNNLWGGSPDTICSGGGSHDSAVTEAYLEWMRAEADAHGFRAMHVVDLGCGDMSIGREFIPHCRHFTGADVVKFVIERHQAELGGESVDFQHLDMVSDDLPEGDICFVRQVFQHLSNRQIACVLPKLRKYRRVYITEHLPSKSGWPANADKPQGAGIRLDRGSGVDLTAPPFGVPEDEVKRVLAVPGNSTGGPYDAGLIVTVLYTPGRAVAEESPDRD